MTSNPRFGEKTTGTEVAERFADRIRGKNILITGVSPKSLGNDLAIKLASHNPKTLILASRSISELEKVKQAIQQSTSTTPILLPFDLSSQTSIRHAASEVKQHLDRLDILIQNAAVVSSQRRETTEGIELQFGVNFVGHFLLTSLLKPLLHPESRIVNVSSLGYVLSPVRFHDWNFEGKKVPEEEQPPKGLAKKFYVSEEKPYYVFTAYGQSKTAVILHAVGLRKMGVRAFAVHPGSIWTDLSRDLGPEDMKLIEGSSPFWKTHDQGIATILVAALDPKLDEVKDDVMLSDCQLIGVEKSASDPEIAERLWSLGEKLTAEQAKL